MCRRARGLENRGYEALEGAKRGWLVLELGDVHVLGRKMKATDLSVGRKSVRAQDQVQNQRIGGVILCLRPTDAGDGDGRDLFPLELSRLAPPDLKGQAAAVDSDGVDEDWRQ